MSNWITALSLILFLTVGSLGFLLYLANESVNDYEKKYNDKQSELSRTNSLIETRNLEISNLNEEKNELTLNYLKVQRELTTCENKQSNYIYSNSFCDYSDTYDKFKVDKAITQLEEDYNNLYSAYVSCKNNEDFWGNVETTASIISKILPFLI